VTFPLHDNAILLLCVIFHLIMLLFKWDVTQMTKIIAAETLVYTSGVRISSSNENAAEFLYSYC